MWGPWVSLRGEGQYLLPGCVGTMGQSERGGAVPPSRVCGAMGQSERGGPVPPSRVCGAMGQSERGGPVPPSRVWGHGLV